MPWAVTNTADDEVLAPPASPTGSLTGMVLPGGVEEQAHSVAHLVGDGRRP